MSGMAISLKSVSKYYKLYDNPKDRIKEALSPFNKKYHKEFYALKNINLEVKKGEILGVVGRNGSGKSTLLKLICGVLSPSHGIVQVNGKISALLELGAGFNPEFTGYDNIYFYATILGLSKQEIDGKIDEIIAFADIGEFITQPIKTYSSGMKSKLGFAVAVHIDPEILILDEVLAVGDALFRRKCHAKMDEFFKAGKTIIFVSHDVNAVAERCTRAILLEDRQILLDKDPKEVSMYYQKLLFSTDRLETESIKEELLRLRFKADKQGVPKENNILPDQDKISENIDNSENSRKPFYVKGFVSETQVQYKNYDVEILNVRLNTLDDGEMVNHVIKNDHYNLTFDVEFNEELGLVKFGFLIKNEKGMIISGYTLPGKKKPIQLVEAGSKYHLSARFIAALEPGVYYFDVGVTSDLKGEKDYVNMIHDVLCFKVLSTPHNSWGLIDLWDAENCQAKEKNRK